MNNVVDLDDRRREKCERQGRAAYSTDADNPYEYGTQDFKDWETGWYEAHWEAVDQEP